MAFESAWAIGPNNEEYRLKTEKVLNDDGFTVKIGKNRIKENTKQIDLFRGQTAGRAGERGFMLIPHVHSCFLTEFTPRADCEYVYDRYTMPVYGVKNEESCYLAVVCGRPFDYELVCGVKDGSYYIYPRFKFGFGADLYEDIEIRFIVLDSTAGYADMAAAYRAYVMGTKGLKRLDERAAENPALKRAVESINVRIRMAWKPVPPPVLEQTEQNEPDVIAAVDFDMFLKIAARLKSEGIDNIDFCLVGWNAKGHDGRYPQLFPVEESLGGIEGLKRAVSAAAQMGYTVNCHSNLTDAYRIADCFDEEYIIKNPDGTLRKDACWSGGQMYQLCPKRAYERFLEPSLSEIRKLGFYGMHYIDVLSIIMPRECYDKNHTVNRGQCIWYFNEMLKKAREIFGGASSEGGMDYLAANLDFSLYSSFNLLGAGDRLCDRKIPFWQLVYHGIILSNPSPDVINCTCGSPAKLLKTIEYGGRPAMYYYSRFVQKEGADWMSAGADLTCDTEENFERGISAVARAARMYQKQSRLQYLYMTGHEQLQPGVFKTTYEDGSFSVVNYNDHPVFAEGRNIPALDYAIVTA